MQLAVQAGRMVVARQGGWATNGSAERMQIDTQESDESMRGADGVEGDVQDALYEAVGAGVPQPPLSVRSGCTVCAPKGAKQQDCDRVGRWSSARQAVQDNSKHQRRREKVTLQPHQITEDRRPSSEDRAPAPAEPPMRDSNPRLRDPKSSDFPFGLLSRCEITTSSVLFGL